MTCLLYWLTSFRGEDFKTFFPIGSYVKTTVCLLKVAGSGSEKKILKYISHDMVAILDGGLGWRSGSQDIILKVDHLRTIHPMFALN